MSRASELPSWPDSVIVNNATTDVADFFLFSHNQSDRGSVWSGPRWQKA